MREIYVCSSRLAKSLANSSRSAGVRCCQCWTSTRLAVSIVSKISLAILLTAARLFREREAGTLQNLQDLIGIGAELVRGGARPAVRAQAEQEGHGEKNAQVPVHALS